MLGWGECRHLADSGVWHLFDASAGFCCGGQTTSIFSGGNCSSINSGNRRCISSFGRLLWTACFSVCFDQFRLRNSWGNWTCVFLRAAGPVAGSGILLRLCDSAWSLCLLCCLSWVTAISQNGFASRVWRCHDIDAVSYNISAFISKKGGGQWCRAGGTVVLTSWRSVWRGRVSLAGKHFDFLDLFGDTCASRTHCHCASRLCGKSTEPFWRACGRASDSVTPFLFRFYV